MVKKEYIEWLDNNRKLLYQFISENNIECDYPEDSNESEWHIEYLLKNVPNIGEIRISFEGYKCVTRFNRRINLLSIYCKFKDFRNESRLLSKKYEKHFNYYSGKYNYHTTPETTLWIDAWFNTLLQDLKYIIQIGGKS